MSKPIPKSLAGQTLAVLLLGLVVSHAIGIGVYSLARHQAVTSTEGMNFVDRVVGVVGLIQRLPDQWREDIVRESDGSTFHVALADKADAARWDRDDDLARDVATYLRTQLSDWTADRFVVSFTEVSSTSEDELKKSRAIMRIFETPNNISLGDGAHDFLHISLRLDNTEWLNFVGAIPKADTAGLAWAGTYILSITVGIGIVAMWLVSRVTAPLTAFASAADRLGKNLRADPLPETGPAEVAQASRAFNAMQERLRRLVENRTQLLAAISHDLRTPITLLRLRAEFMENAQNQAKVIRTLDEMETMIASILDFTKATFHDEPQRQVDLSALISSICDDWADSGAEVTFDPPDQLPFICRRMELKRALTNLIDNAVKYGGDACVSVEAKSGAIDIVIDDHGPGIPDDQREMIFIPFYRIDRAGDDDGSVGLGLSIAQAIIHGHGGNIDLENRPGGGLRARVSLPA
jgi:signal transduction histidine kinase